MMERTVVSEIVCQKIRLVDSQGDTVAVLGTEKTEETESPNPTFQMYNAEGLAALKLSVDSQGAGSVVVFNKHEKPAVTVLVDSEDDSGEIIVWREGKPVAQIDSDADGGRVSVNSTKDENSGVTVGVNSDGDSGEIIVWREGKPVVGVNSDADGGRVSVNSAKDANSGVAVRMSSDGDSGDIVVWRDGEIAASVSSDADGGRVSVNSTKGAAVLAFAEADGGGTVLTLEDGNITSRMPRGGR